MDEFANKPKEDQAAFFEQTAEKMGLPSQLVEKDFWVCFALKALFSLPEISEHLTFKGGTSLSKIYKVIERFSEDIDFAISREWLGFGGDQAPDANEISGVKREKRLVELGVACQQKVENELLPALESKLKQVLNSDEWKLDFENAKGNQQINFTYPTTKSTQNTGYVPSFVRIELTARTDNHPAHKKTLVPYVAEKFPNAITNPDVTGNVLLAERTFWEKATILHQFHFQEDPQKIAPGFSRHYYDVFQLDSKGYSDKSIDRIDLLPEVADHKTHYYRQGWARYDLARSPSTLELIPHVNVLEKIGSDYEDMREMIFGDQPEFKEIIERLKELKEKINQHDESA